MTTSNGVKIVFLGTSQFGAIVLEKLAEEGQKPNLVVTAPDKPVGRKQVVTSTPVKVLAQKYGIPVSFNLEDLKREKPDLTIVAAYGKILKKEILDIPKYGSINVHASLLPKYRGPSPIQTAILNGEKETGVTVILMDEKIDHGPIIGQEKTIIAEDETADELHDRLAFLGAKLLIKLIPDWISGKIKPSQQNEKEASYAKKLGRNDGEIDWRKTAGEIDRQIRALNPWPGTYTFYKGRKLKILEADILGNKLIIKKVQLEGRKPMSFNDFLLGHKDYVIPY